MDTAKKLADWNDPRVQKVYEILCDTETEPPEGHHWEGFQAQRIVAALSTPVAADAADDIRELRKWLNEEPNRPIDRAALARVLSKASAQEPVALTDEPRAPKAFRAPEPGTPWWQTAKDCGAWTDRQDGDLGYIHFGSTEALRVYTMKISEQARQSALAASQPAPVEARPTDDALWDKTLKERDDYHEWADQLAARIATITGVGIGEHSSANHPWQNAVDAADEFNAGTRSGFTSQEIINACDAAGIDDRAYKRLMSVLKSSPVEAQAAPEGWLFDYHTHGRPHDTLTGFAYTETQVRHNPIAKNIRRAYSFAAAPTPSKGEA